MHLLDVVQHGRPRKEAMKGDDEVVFVGGYETEADRGGGEQLSASYVKIVNDILCRVIDRFPVPSSCPKLREGYNLKPTTNYNQKVG